VTYPQHNREKLLEEHDKWMMLAQRTLAYLPRTLGISREIRDALDPAEVERAIARNEQRLQAALANAPADVPLWEVMAHGLKRMRRP
jgi:hypothetical protein